MRLDIGDALIKQAIKNIDMAQYEVYVAEAVDAYFKSEEFADQIGEALSEEGFGWELVEPLKKSLRATLKNIKFEVSV
jgi:ATP-dependent RNA circularization protein (DNA/RNA ligase family)